jgi:MarR family 2-MHQ and catechol resistance regulon transcriptional repressor
MSAEPTSSYPVPQDESLLPVFRALAECFQQVTRVGTRHIESMGVTGSQFDALVVLGDTSGMTCKELGQRSLISGGTLTPVLDRLESKGLVKRVKCDQDNRQTIVSLTSGGQALYEAVFLPHIAYMRTFSDQLTTTERQDLVQLLGKLKEAFTANTLKTSN